MTLFVASFTASSSSGSLETAGLVPKGKPTLPLQPRCTQSRKGIEFYVRATAEWRSRMGAGRSDSTDGPGKRQRASCPHVRHLAKVWRRRATAARRAYLRWYGRTYAKWRCIHEHEGAWNSNTGNGYNGGLQMTSWFQATYGPEFLRRWGPAHLWPIWAQLIAAERAYATSGFRQWPNTARMCGLL